MKHNQKQIEGKTLSRDNDVVEYVNVTQIVGAIIGNKLATLYELQTVYGLEDALNLVEILTVDAYNNRKAQNVGRY